jgi:GT2 family glycosyltransferase
MLKPDLEIVILNYNTKHYIEKCLNSLQNNYINKSRYKVTVTVVDNNSNDGSADYLNSIENINFIRSEKNGGFAFGNNLAISASQARYIMLLNSDTEIPDKSSSIDELIEVMDKDETVAVITPKVILGDGTLDKACHRGEPDLWNSFCHFSGLEKIFKSIKNFNGYHLTYLDLKTPHYIEACTGAAMLVRNEAIAKTGLLDERFFMYAEDLDWCKRFRDNGYKISYYPYTVILHHKYGSGIKNSEKKLSVETKKWFYKTMLIYYDKHYSKKHSYFFRLCIALFVRLKTINPGK